MSPPVKTPRYDVNENCNCRPECRTLLVTQLPRTVDAEVVYQHFASYGDCRVHLALDESDRPRGFAYLDYEHCRAAKEVLSAGIHVLHRVSVRVKPKLKNCPCNCESEPVSTVEQRRPERKKMFVGGLPPNLVEQELRAFFEEYGRVAECYIIYDASFKRSRGFGFVSFENESIADYFCGEHYVSMHGKTVECRLAQPKDNPNALVNSENRVMGAPQPVPTERKQPFVPAPQDNSVSTGTDSSHASSEDVSMATTAPPTFTITNTTLPLDQSLKPSDAMLPRKEMTPSPLPNKIANEVSVSQDEVDCMKTTEDALTVMCKFYHLLNIFLLKAMPLLPTVQAFQSQPQAQVPTVQAFQSQPQPQVPPTSHQTSVYDPNAGLHMSNAFPVYGSQPMQIQSDPSLIWAQVPPQPPSPHMMGQRGPDMSLNMPVVHSPGPFLMASSPIGSPAPAPHFVFF